MDQRLEELKKVSVFKAPTAKEDERLKEKVKSRFDGRWVIIFLFLLTVFASLFFWLRTEIPRWLADFFIPEIVISKPPKISN